MGGRKSPKLLFLWILFKSKPEQEYDKTKFVSFDAPPPPERPPADDEGHEKEDQDEGKDEGDE